MCSPLRRWFGNDNLVSRREPLAKVFRLRLRPLEDRLTPTTFVVTTSADNGNDFSPTPGSLREAIIFSNNTIANPGPDTILFNIGSGPITINPTYFMPTATGPVTIDGTSQPGYNGSPIVEISGAVYGAGALSLAGSNSTVRGLVINDFDDSGLHLLGNNNVVQGCYIGTDITGTLRRPNGNGILIHGNSNTIGGFTGVARNVISGNYNRGIFIDDGNSNVVQGNYIGTDVTGMMAISNDSGNVVLAMGWTLNLNNNLIGGDDAADGTVDGIVNAGNVISGSENGVGVYVGGVAGSGNKVQGNIIGLNAAGNAPIPNYEGGVFCSNLLDTLIGGTTAGAGNIISGNNSLYESNGIYVSSYGPVGAPIIQGNLIGTDKTGTIALGNSHAGVYLDESDGVLVGGNSLAARNVISGNSYGGVIISGNANGNKVQGNFIGTTVNGMVALPNQGFGVFVSGMASDNLIGGTAAGTRNVISGNTEDGILFSGSTGNLNKVYGNFIGIAASGMAAVPNGLSGVAITDSKSVQIGGGGTGESNLISGNTKSGISISGADCTENKIQGNLIGVGADNTTPVGNKVHGIYVKSAAHENLIGGSVAGEGNTIAFNGDDLGSKGHGIEIESGTKNAIRRNLIFKNKGRGIDLNHDWVTINDPTDADPGANDSQDYPVLIYRPQGATDIGVHTWKLNSTPSQAFTIEIFENPGLDPADYGEGAVYITQMSVTTLANGDATFTFDHTGKSFITMTATDSVGNTSEFSLVDTDADALADVWELAEGLDIDQDGMLTANEKILTGARRDHKDLFVEVDAMMGFAPGAAIFDPATLPINGGVIRAFAAATNLNVHNPDQADGINLHVVYDEKMLNPVNFATIDNPFPEFQVIKNGSNGMGTDGRFGTSAQRADAKWMQIRKALTLTHRYSMFADKYSFTSRDAMGNVNTDSNGNPIIIDSSSGLAELHGNDFFVTFGAAVWNMANFGLTDVDRAGTWMHELGHTLGLHHGGAINDGTNHKPNYHSVMNYVWQYPHAFKRQGAAIPAYANSWRLDYSSQTLGPLDESMLVEGNGISVANPMFTVPYGEKGMGYGLATADGNGVNWNFDGNTGGTVQIDINFSGRDTDVFQGHNDWANLRYGFLEQASFASGYSKEPDFDEGPQPYELPRVASVKINDGSAQRSRVTSLTVTFDQHIDITFSLADAFVVTRQGDGKLPNMVTSVDDSGATTVVTLTFIGSNAVENGSLADGRYTLTVIDNKVSNGFSMLDGDGNGQPGGNYILASAVAPNPPTNIFRLFGDADGNATVNAADFNAFRLVYGSSGPSIFDFDNSGSVSAADFNQFRLRYGVSIVP